jgi:asparagine synthase (glutamine-hydrolysing)
MVKQFIILIAADDALGEELSNAARAFGTSAGWPPASALRFPGPAFRELIVWTEDPADEIDLERREASVLLGLAAFTEDGERLSPRTLLERVAARGTGALARIAAPQSVVLAFGDPAQVIAATDHVGLSAVYHATRGGTAAAGSSSRLLATLLGCSLDEDAISAYAVLGEYAATDTPFRGVRRLASGHCARLGERGLTVEEYGEPVVPQRGPRDLERAVAEGVAAVRAGVDACVTAYPEFTMELSGGLDSRVILAALLAAGRRPSQAITLGEPGHPDVVVAKELASRFGIPHQHIDLTAMASLSPPEALRIADTAGCRRDYSGDCVALGVLEFVEGVAGFEPRFSGQNGELARGFYYPFQPPWPQTADVLSRSLVRWRLMANERASGELLVSEVGAAGERRAAQTTQAYLESTGSDWLTATDLLYLNWRMQRWLGGDWSASMQSRPILAPFFHLRYVGWALSSPPRLKRGSRLLARVLDAIDPALAGIQMANGDTPTAIFRPELSDRISHMRHTAEKVAVKVRQRLGDVSRPPVGAPVLARLALDAMVDERHGLERVAALPFISREYVDRVAESRQASPTTVGMLVGLRGLAINGA